MILLEEGVESGADILSLPNKCLVFLDANQLGLVRTTTGISRLASAFKEARKDFKRLD